MIFDYRFFEEYARRRRTYSAWNAAGLAVKVFVFFGDWDLAKLHYKVLSERPKGSLDFDIMETIQIVGACWKGGQSLGRLADSLNTEIPLDLRQFCEKYGETLIFSRGKTVRIISVAEMIELFEDEPDIEITEGRFFRFAKFDGTIYYLGLRRDDLTNKWQVVLCSHGLLYSEMIGPEGRECVVIESFYDWLKELVETNGYPDRCAPRNEKTGYLDVIDDGEPTREQGTPIPDLGNQ